MDEILQDETLNEWFSTYGLITAERILGNYNIILPPKELLVAIKSPFSFYNILSRIPLKHVLNGIILQQANDYHIYAQKLFIDYLLSGESSKSELSQGALTRESLEEERQQLVTVGENFHKLQLKQNSLIAHSQVSLKKTAKAWSKEMETALGLINTTLKNYGFASNKSTIRKALDHALIHCDYIKVEAEGKKHIFVEEFNKVLKVSLTHELNEAILDNLSAMLEIMVTFNDKFQSYLEQTTEMMEQAQSYRTQFYDTILRVVELIKLLPEYKINPVQDEINRESLYFDRTIGNA